MLPKRQEFCPGVERFFGGGEFTGPFIPEPAALTVQGLGTKS